MRSAAIVALIASFLALLSEANAASTTVYSTGFEPAEGFRPDDQLAGQNGWISLGSGDNGFTGPATNRQAYLGYSAFGPDSELSTAVWKPLRVGPVSSNSVVRFSVDFSITDSSPGENYDEFHWSVYNTNDVRLLSLIFDNFSYGIFYSTNGGGFVDTGFSFSNSVDYHLVITMNFVSNRWNAIINGTDLEINERLATNMTALSVGDVDAVWSYRDPAAPGDNFMIFDNYRVGIDTSSKPTVQAVSSVNRQFRLRVFGDADFRYAVDARSSVLPGTWVSLGTNSPVDGSFDLLDPVKLPPSARFYRARWVPW